MEIKFKKFLILSLVVTLRSHGLTLPGTAPLMESQETTAGAIKWPVSEWDEEEYKKMEQAVDKILRSSSGLDIMKLVRRIAEGVSEVIPGRTFSVTIGSFGIEYETVKKKGE